MLTDWEVERIDAHHREVLDIGGGFIRQDPFVALLSRNQAKRDGNDCPYIWLLTQPLPTGETE